MKRLIVLTILVAAVLTGSAHAATRTWHGQFNSAAASEPANWIEGVAPATGDDVVFPGSAIQFSIYWDLPASVVLQSLTFQGANYSFIPGVGGTTERLTIAGGSADLGPDVWTLRGSLDVTGVLIAELVLDTPVLDATVAEGGGALLTVHGNVGDISKHGDGVVLLYLTNATVGNSYVNGGELDLHPWPGRVISGDVIAVNSSIRLLNTDTGNVRVSGTGSRLLGFGVVAPSLELTDNATFFTLECSGRYPSLFETATAPNLTGAKFRPPTSRTCEGRATEYLISNTSPDPVVGEFQEYPEGMIFYIGSRRFKMTYRGGDGNDVQILAIPAKPFDLTGDGRASISVFRPSDGVWYVQTETGLTATQWGTAADKLVPGDYDGDGKTDIGVYRPSEGRWYIIQSYDSTVRILAMGQASDIPTPADFDGDGKVDETVFHPANGLWTFNLSVFYGPPVQFGLSGDIPVAADYDGDQIADLAVFRPSEGAWYILRSTGGIAAVAWGLSTDKAVPADYDGDGKVDIAVYRPSEGVWYQLLSSTQQMSAVNWGNDTDLPVAGDYDGDGRSDVAIFRPSDGNWWINGTTSGITVQQFGVSGDKPIPNAFVR